jgi:hypothetical protein
MSYGLVLWGLVLVFIWIGCNWLYKKVDENDKYKGLY